MLILISQQSHPQSPKLSKASSPAPARLDGYDRAHCVSLPKGIRICKALADSLDAFVLENEGKRVGTWPGMTTLGETGDFEVLEADLDNDGHAELIISNHDSTSNGMGVVLYTISIFSSDALINFRSPLSFSVEEYGSFGTFVSAGRNINILATRWQWTKDPRRRRGTGLYLMGQWWRYVGGELVPAPNRSTLARRFLQSFADERDNTQENPAIPFKWLSGPRAETFRVDPLVTQKGQSMIEGVITEVSSENKNDRRTLTIGFRPDDGASVTFSYPRDFGDEGGYSLAYIGELKQNRIFPSRYIPTSPDHWLKGRRATVITYSEGDQRILWLKSR